MDFLGFIVEVAQVAGAVATIVLAVIARRTVRSWKDEKIHEIKTELHSSVCILKYKAVKLLEYSKKINVGAFDSYLRSQIKYEVEQFDSYLRDIEKEISKTHKLSLDLKANKARDIAVEPLWKEINEIWNTLRFDDDVTIHISDEPVTSELDLGGYIDIGPVQKKIELLEKRISKLYEISSKEL